MKVRLLSNPIEVGSYVLNIKEFQICHYLCYATEFLPRLSQLTNQIRKFTCPITALVASALCSSTLSGPVLVIDHNEKPATVCSNGTNDGSNVHEVVLAANDTLLVNELGFNAVYLYKLEEKQAEAGLIDPTPLQITYTSLPLCCLPLYRQPSL